MNLDLAYLGFPTHSPITRNRGGIKPRARGGWVCPEPLRDDSVECVEANRRVANLLCPRRGARGITPRHPIGETAHGRVALTLIRDRFDDRFRTGGGIGEFLQRAS